MARKQFIDDSWLEEDENLVNPQQMELMEKSFSSPDFINQIQEENKLKNLTEQQELFINYLEKLKIGTFHKGTFKAWNNNKSAYFVDCGGFDVKCKSLKRETEYWDNPVGKELTVLIVRNADFKVDAISVDAMVSITWRDNIIRAQGVKLENYKHITDYDKDKIRLFVAQQIEAGERVSDVYLFDKALIAKNLTVIKKSDIVVEKPLLSQALYEWSEPYSIEESIIDPNNPNFQILEDGRITSKKYTQMPFYSQSSQIKKTLNIRIV